MKYVKKFFALPELYCVLVLLAAIAAGVYTRVSVENVTLTRGDTSEAVSMPVAQKMGDGEYFQVDFDVAGNGPYDLQVVPDDCAESVTINGNLIRLGNYRGNCDYSKGFALPDSLTAPHRIGKKTHYKFFLKNSGGNAGLNVVIGQKSVLADFAKAGALIAFALLALMVARRLKFGWRLAFLVFIAVLFRATFFANVAYTNYAHDVDAHVAYVQYIIEKHAIPGVDDCWTCYHPPVYYVSASPSFIAGERLGYPGTTGLQAFSLLLSVLTLFFGLLFLRQFLKGGAFGVASVLWAFWPVMLLASPRIGNDQMFYMLHVLCMFGGIKYLNSGRGKFLILSVIATALAMWTKTTAVVTLGTLILFAISGYVLNARSLRPTRSELVAWGMFLALVVAIVLQRLLGDADLVGNSSGLNHRLKVGNEAFNYIYFDLQNFMTHPFTSPWDDDLGRQLFWNYSFKTSLFGEFNLVHNATGRTLATFISGSFVGLAVYAARGFWRNRLRAMHWILLLQGVAFFGALMFLRIKHPYACSNDFRYILPVVLCFIPFVAQGITLEGASTKWKVLGYALTFVFVACTAVLYILAM